MELKSIYIIFRYGIFLIGLSPNISTAQIFLTNPSFEDEPADATMPTGWWSIDRHTTPDILPGYWGVYEEASDGETFIGLITRDNNSHESIGQKLSATLKKGSCYSMSLDLAHSNTYAAYSSPARVRIYISTKKKDKQQLIFESKVIKSEEWENVRFKFKPEKDMRYFIIEIYHEKMRERYKSNILIDNISEILICDKA